MNATTPASTATGPGGDGGGDRLTQGGRNSSTCARVPALTDRWIVGGWPANDICGWTYQPRAVISSHTVNASHDPSVDSATSVESGGTTRSSPGTPATPATIRSTASNTSRVRAR